MPEDSFVLKYFRFIKQYLSIGPPVYFVVSGLNYSSTKHQNLICGGQYCNDDSLSTQLFIASKTPNYTYIARPPSSWIDDFFDWTGSSSCCKYFPNNGSFCPHPSKQKLKSNYTQHSKNNLFFVEFLTFFFKLSLQEQIVIVVKLN